MNVFQAFIQGVVQGLTEFLPVSSSGHLSLAQHFMDIENGGFLFSVILHLGTLIAVFVAFFSRIKALTIEFVKMICDIFRGRFKLSECSAERRMILMLILSLVPVFFVYPLKDSINVIAEDNDIIFEGVCFFYTGILLLVADRMLRRPLRVDEVTAGRAVFIGVMQTVALLPGVSRSGSTIGAGIIAGVNREYMVAYSFILGIPVIIAASIIEIGGAVSQGITVGVFPLLIGFLTAAIVGWLSIKMLSWMIKNDKLWIFSIYLFLVGGFSVIGGICGL